MKDLLKFATTISRLPVPLVGFLVAVSLLFEKVVSFDQALLLVFVAVGVHYVVIGGAQVQGPSGDAEKRPVGSLQPPKAESRARRAG